MPVGLDELRQAARKRKRAPDEAQSTVRSSAPEPSPSVRGGRGITIRGPVGSPATGPRTRATVPRVSPVSFRPTAPVDLTPAPRRVLRPAQPAPKELPGSSGAGPSSVPSEDEGLVIKGVKLSDSGLTDNRIAKKLLGGIILPSDIDACQQSTVGDVCRSALHVVAYIGIMSEMKRKNDELERRATWAEERVKKLEEEVKGVEKLKSANEGLAESAARTERLLEQTREELSLAKSAASLSAQWESRANSAWEGIRRLEEKAQMDAQEIGQLQEKLRTSENDLQAAPAEALKDYFASEEYAELRADDAADAYLRGIDDCRARVQNAFPDVDLRFLDEDEGEVGLDEAPLSSVVPLSEASPPEVPAAEAPLPEVPAAEAPLAETPTVEVPPVEALLTDVSSAEAPPTEISLPGAPPTEAPPSESPCN